MKHADLVRTIARGAARAGLVAQMKPSYTAVAESAYGWWAITVAELPGVFAQSRRLEGVEAMARDAIGLLLDLPRDSFDVVVREVLDPDVDALVAASIAARRDAAERQRLATTSTIAAARALAAAGLPQRDIGRLLQLSHQRVAQLLAGAEG
jgi:predicted RNase H-like HicB family nuclease